MTRTQPRWLGLIVLVAAAVSAYVLSVRGQTGAVGYSGTLYDRSRWFLLVLLVAAGIGLLVRHAVVTQVAGIVGAISAAQLSTTGMVAAKHWRPLSGFSGFGETNLTRLILLAWVLIVAAGVATIACLVAARASDVRRDDEPYRYRWVGLAAGVILAAVLPLVLGIGHGHTAGLRSMIAYALLYSLPWGIAIAASGWLNRVGAMTALATVVVCAVAAAASHDVLAVKRPERGFLPTIVLAIVLAVAVAVDATRIKPDQPNRPAQASQAD